MVESKKRVSRGVLKSIFLVILMTFLGCSQFIPRKDLQALVKNNNGKLVLGDNEMVLYRVSYPSEYKEQLEFWQDYGKILAVLSIGQASYDVLVSEEYAMDEYLIRKDGFLAAEQIYLKTASELTPFEKESLLKTSTHKGEFDDGEAQYLLSKQIDYWCNYLGETYYPKNLYSERDKAKLIEKVFEERRKLQTFLENSNLKKTVVIERELTESDDELLNQLPKDIVALYLKDIVVDRDYLKFRRNRKKVNHPIVIVKSNVYSGYDKSRKLITIYKYQGQGTPKKLSYYKGYDLGIKVEEMKTLDEYGVIWKDTDDMLENNAPLISDILKLK